MRIPIIKSRCEWERCDEQAEYIVSGRKNYPGVRYYCAIHAPVVEDDEDPEYTVDCPNCGCRFGVN